MEHPTENDLYQFLTPNYEFSKWVILSNYPFTENDLLKYKDTLEWELVVLNDNIIWTAELYQKVKPYIPISKEQLFNQESWKDIYNSSNKKLNHNCEYCFKDASYVIQKDSFSMAEISQCPNFNWDYKLLDLIENAISDGFIDTKTINYFAISPYFKWSLKVFYLFQVCWDMELLVLNKNFGEYIVGLIKKFNFFDTIMDEIHNTECDVTRDFPILFKEEYDWQTRLGIKERKFDTGKSASDRKIERRINDLSIDIKIDPDDHKSYYDRARLKINLKDYEGAFYDFSIVSKIDPNYPTIYNSMGFCCDKLGFYNQAIQYYTKAIELAPKEAIIYGNRGFSKEALGEIEGANNDFEKAMQLDDKVYLKHIDLGKELYRQRKFEEAIERFSQAISLNHLSGEAFYLRGITQKKLFGGNIGIEDFLIALSLGFDPSKAGYIKKKPDQQ